MMINRCCLGVDRFVDGFAAQRCYLGSMKVVIVTDLELQRAQGAPRGMRVHVCTSSSMRTLLATSIDLLLRGVARAVA